MATGGDSHVLNCAICFESKTNKNPRGLPCQHSFCLSCIQQWHTTRVNQGKEDKISVECPVCRQQTRLPDGGISSLPVDFKVSEVADILKGSKSEFLCQTCAQNGLSKPMKAMCKTCNRRLCQECISRHKGVKIFSSHVIVDDLCADHKASVEYFCLKCMDRLCTDCVIGESHQNHNIIQINEAETEIKAHITKKQMQLDKEIDDLEGNTRAMKQLAVKHTERVFTTALDRWNEAKKQLDNHIVSSIHEHWKKHLQAIEQFYQSYFRKCSHAKSDCQDCAFLIQGETPLEHTLIKAIEKALNSTKESIFPGPMPRAHFICATTCRPVRFDTMAESIISSNFSCNFGETLEGIKKIQKLHLLLNVPFGIGHPVKSANQIKILPNGSVIVSDFRGPARKLSKEGEWGPVYEEEQHRSAICVYNDAIYIAPRTGSTVLKYASDGGVEIFQMVPSLKYVHQIQVYEDDVYLLISRVGLEQRSLQNCSFRKMLISQNGLCSFLRVPFAKSYQFFCANERGNKVEVFDGSGNLLNTIGSDMLQNPTDVKLLGNGNIIVADNDHDRILEFHTSGTFVRELLTQEDGLCNPNDMDYLHPYLWVTQGKEDHDKAILLYKFT